MIFEFDINELEENYTSEGYRNQTGYKVSAFKLYNSGKIRELNKERVYQIINRENMEINDNFFKEKGIAVYDVARKTHVLASHKSKEIYYGPYIVEERVIDKKLQIFPAIRESLFIVNGYKISELNIVSLDEPRTGKTWNIALVPKTLSVTKEDVIEDDDLVENFQDSISNSNLNSEMISVKDLPSVVAKSSASFLANPNIPVEIRKSRVQRLSSKLASAQNLTENISSISTILSNAVVSYIKSNPNTLESDVIVKSLLNSDPQLIEKIKDQRLISAQIEKGKEEIEEISEKKKTLGEEISSLEAKKASILNEADIEAIKQQKNGEILVLEQRKQEIESELYALQESLKISRDLISLRKEKEDLDSRIKRLNEHATYATESFQDIFNKNQKKMQEIVFDGFVSNKLMQAAADWEIQQDSKNLKGIVDSEKKFSVVEKSPKELTDYIYKLIHKARPLYKKNLVTNIAICMFQSFLTVFSGEPGCGKTSICNLMADVLGLNKTANYIDGGDSRYIQVSVERGWTSKRDLIGYYNPLSKTFDKSDKRLFNGLSLLNEEKTNGVAKLPFVVLLDEANLSPMEYYWADFMNVCDDLKKNDRINFGENYIFSIPETLHFIATINNDHTTETLSPRLIDRAFIVTLPQFSFTSHGKEITDEEIEIISWKSISEAFIPDMEPGYDLPSDIKQIYDAKIKIQLQKMRKPVSTRTDLAVKKYFKTASKLFEKESELEDVNLIALDYAISQKILPKINGSGNEFKSQLEGLRDICRDNGLYESQARVQEIITNGQSQMGYYNFFN